MTDPWDDEDRAIAAAHACTNDGASSAIRTSPRRRYGRMTSRIDVDTTGLPAARYSGVLVGLMKRVASLRANGRIATSQALKYFGKSSYDFGPR